MDKKHVINSPLSINGELISDNLKKADLFNDYFIKQSSIDEFNVRIPYLPRFRNTNIPIKTVESSEVFKILNTLNTNKATGPDQIGNRILKESSRVLEEPLSKLFNICIRSGIFPSAWKRAHVIPLHNSGDLTLCNIYRPISLLSSVSKVFERVIFKHIYQFLKLHNLLSEKQSGFIPRDSTVNQLTKICHEFFSEFDKGNEICAVFLDFSKAFDKVWHKVLLYKLDRYGVNGSFLKLMASYLGGREQRVIMQNAESTWGPITAGVPQGSVLGPLLFLLYINDLCDDIESVIDLFADDCSLFQKIDKNYHKYVNTLNRDLKKYQSGAKTGFLSLIHKKLYACYFQENKYQLYCPLLF